MSDLSKIALVREMLDSAERSVREARKILAELTGDTPLTKSSIKSHNFEGLSPSQQGESGRIIEGVFDGQGMVDPTGKTYPIPANYASKSKLVQGDKLKLTIDPSGRFIYKSIAPVPRKNIVGTLTYENGQYKILAEGNAYRVLLASVTFHRVEVGGQASILIPDGPDAEWAAIDALIPNGEAESAE